MERLYQIYIGSKSCGRPMTLSTTAAIDVWQWLCQERPRDVVKLTSQRFCDKPVQVTEAIGYAGAKVQWLNGTYPRRWHPLSRLHAFNSVSISQLLN